MSFLAPLIASIQARLDAHAGIDAKDRRMTASHGLAPTEVERGSYLHREAVEAVTDTGRLEEYREDVQRGEDAQALVGTPLPYTLGLAAVWAIEFAGALLVLRSLGVPDSHRVLPAAALTLTLIALTKLTMKLSDESKASTAPPPPTDGGAPPGAASAPAPSRFPLARYTTAVLYGVLVLAIALVRVMGSDGEDVPAIVLWSEAAIMIAVSAGPAFAAAWLERRRAPTVELARQLSTLRARVRAEERRIARARVFLRKLDRAQVAWTQDNARGRAAYSVAHERTLASRNSADEGDDA
jgi:hypothetical protein